MSSEQASAEDHATIEYATDFSWSKIGEPGELEILHKAKGILEGWINFDAKNPNNGNFKIKLQQVNDLINANKQVEESKKKKNAGRRRRKNQKSRKSKKSRKVRKTRKN
jgi:hypothetical protein